MKVREAIEILRQMNPDKEVKLTFGRGNEVHDYSDCQPGSSIPGESQEERFGSGGGIVNKGDWDR
jgi:hypothetical protein